MPVFVDGHAFCGQWFRGGTTGSVFHKSASVRWKLQRVSVFLFVLDKGIAARLCFL